VRPALWNTDDVVQSVERAFAVLRCLAGGPAGVSSVANRVGLPKSTVSRLLSTLTVLGAVEQSAAGNQYRIGPALADLAAGALAGRNLPGVARPHLVELVEALDETAGLSVLEGRDVVYLDQVGGDHPVQVRDWTGERIPAHQVSSGLVLLANMDGADLDRYLDGPLPAATGRTTTDPAALRQRLRDIAAVGTAWTIDEYVPGIASAAAAVVGARGRVVAAIHVHGPSYRFPALGAEARVAALLADAARRIGARLADVADGADGAAG
jgi:DNA-binding IclR family transcriptional regulator